MLKLKKHALLPILGMLSSVTVHAQEHAHTRSNSDAHIHGIASMTIALDQGVMEVEYESPAVNLVGFETIAKTDEQILAAEKAKSQLESATTLFIIEGSNCEVTESNVNFSAILGDIEHTDDHETHENDHDTDHHAHENEHDEEHEENHSELSAHYQFKCDNTENVSSINVTLFEQFPTLEEIDAMWITEANQGAIKLSINNTIVRLE